MRTDLAIRDARMEDAAGISGLFASYGSSVSADLYLGAGFEQVGRLRRVGFKHGRRIDTVLTQRELDRPAR